MSPPSQSETLSAPRRPLSPSLLSQYLHSTDDPRQGSASLGRLASSSDLLTPVQGGKSELVLPELLEKRLERSSNRVLEERRQVGLQHLLAACKEAERKGRGPECTQFSSMRRMRGLDILYGMQAEEGETEDSRGPQGTSLGSTPAAVTRPSTSGSVRPNTAGTVPPAAGSARRSTLASGLAASVSPGQTSRRSTVGNALGTLRSSASVGPTRPNTAASFASSRTGQSRGGRRRSSALANGNLATKRAAELLRNVPFFQRLEEQTPGILAQMTVGVTFSMEKAGQAVFRQGDPPSACYVVASGEVVCYKNQGGPLTSKKLKRPPTPRDRYEARMFLSLTDALAKKSRGREVNGVPRYMTSEGFSTFSEQSLLGDEVARLGPGGLFGERALQEEDLRAASVVCVQDCEFVVIQSTLYRQVMRESIEKVGFLNNSLSGLRSLPYTTAEKHPSILFVSEVLQEGHTFLHEGIVCTEPAVYVIKRGTVEFRRFSHASHCPAAALADRPLVQPARGPDMSSSRGARLDELAGPSAPGAGEGARGDIKAGEQAVWDTLCEGDVFSSLALLPLLSPEPFTVVSATRSGCEVYRAQGEALLGLSVKLLKPLRRQLLKRMQTRLMRLPGAAEAALRVMLGTPSRTD